WDYEIDPQARDNPMLRYSQARVLGGCSAHNTSIGFDPCSWDLREWEDCGAEGWGVVGTAAALERVHRQVKFEDSTPQGLGPMCVAAAQEWGLAHEAFDRPDLVDVIGYFKLTKDGAQRESTASAYLFPLEEIVDNLTVRTQVMVEKLIIEN